MADYVHVIAQAVARLATNDAANREALYQRARTALVEQLREIVTGSELVRVQRDLEDTLALMAEDVEGLFNIVERKLVSHKGSQIHTAVFDHRHQAPHPLLPAGAKRRDDLLVAESCVEGLVRRDKLA